jgi:hypothetical protein
LAQHPVELTPAIIREAIAAIVITTTVAVAVVIREAIAAIYRLLPATTVPQPSFSYLLLPFVFVLLKLS